MAKNYSAITLKSRELTSKSSVKTPARQPPRKHTSIIKANESGSIDIQPALVSSSPFIKLASASRAPNKEFFKRRKEMHNTDATREK